MSAGAAWIVPWTVYSLWMRRRDTGNLKRNRFSTPYLFGLMVIPSITMNVSICMTQSWIAWGVSYAKVSTREHLKKTLPYAWIICIIMQAITYVMFG